MLPRMDLLSNNSLTSSNGVTRTMRSRETRAHPIILPINNVLFVIVSFIFMTSFIPNTSSSLPRGHPLRIFTSYSQRKPNEYLEMGSKFFANDSLLGASASCTREEKECLRYNRILFSADGRCYPLGDGPGGCRFVVDQCEFERTGHIRGKCAPSDLCRPLNTNQVVAAFTGKCMKTKKLLSACGPGPVNLVQHFFGGAECERPKSIAPEDPVYIEQPPREGRCAFPNLRHDISSISNEVNIVRFKRCSQQQSVCFAKKQVWFAGDRKCYDLLGQGPCSEGQWLVLNRTAWEVGEVRADCVRVHPCGGSARLMAFDGKCYHAATVLRVFCPGGVMLPNAFGEMACITRDFYRHVVDLTSARPEACELTQRVSFGGEDVAAYLVPECGLINEEGKCQF